MRKIVFLAACAASTLALRAEYKPEAWNLEARQKFAEQRFGIFIHWGIGVIFDCEVLSGF